MKQKQLSKPNKRSLSHWAIEAIHAEEALTSQFVGQRKALSYMSAIYATYRCGLENGPDWLAPRLLCTGTLSSGKTSAIQAVAKLLNLPVATVSIANLSPSGFKGGTLTDALNGLVAQAGSVQRLEQRGAILHVDEICKYSEVRKADSIFESVIYNLLGVLGGETVQVDSGDGFETAYQFKTNRILIFLSGAFTKNKPSSFLTEDRAIKTLIRLGYPKEFISRLSGHVHFEKLSDAQMLEAIKFEISKMKISYRMGENFPILPTNTAKDILQKTKRSGLGLRSARLYLQNEFIKSANEEKYRSLA